MPVQDRLAAADSYAKALAAGSSDAAFEPPKQLTQDVVSRVGKWRAATEEWDTSTAEMTIIVRGGNSTGRWWAVCCYYLVVIQ